MINYAYIKIYIIYDKINLIIKIILNLNSLKNNLIIKNF